MVRKIGEVFEFAGRDGCYFLERKCLEKVHGECCDDYREDNTDVIFKEITDEESK